MSKLFFAKMKAAEKIMAIFAVLLFLWVMSVTVSPIKPNRIKRVPVCDINNISSWGNIGGDLKITSFKSSAVDTNRTEFVYQHPPTQPGQPELWCKFPIPEMVLYKALTLNVTYKLNQPASFEIGMRRVGMGPESWKPVEIDSNNTNKLITSTWLLNEPARLKLNWLSGPYEEVVFRISKFDPNKELILNIYQVYLE